MHQAEYYRGFELAQQALRGAQSRDLAERAAAVHAALAPALADTPLAPLRACREGCDHCCHLPVGVTYPEALALAGALAERPGLADRVVASAQDSAERSWRELAHLPCPLLDGGACAAYDQRPLPCRALASADAVACADSRRGLANAPVDDVAFLRGLGATAALGRSTRPQGTRELRAALAAVLTAGPSRRAAAFAAARAPT